MIDITNKNKAKLLAALYNNAKPQGMGMFHYTPEPMTEEEAKYLLEKNTYFDYLKGRVLKVDLSQNQLDPWGYDRDNGNGTCERIVNNI